MKYIKYIIILIALIPTYGYAAPNKTYLTNSVFVATTTAGCLEFSALGEIFSKGTTCGAGGGGGGGAGTFSTTTSTVAGQLINYANNATDILTIGSNSTTTAELYFDPNTNRFIVASGNVGIGTSSPLYPLVIRRPGGSGSLGVTINNELSASGRDAVFKILPDIAGSFLGGYLFQTNNSSSGAVNALSISAAGNVGVGTTSPLSALQVQGGANKNIQIGATASAYTTASTFTDLTSLINAISMSRNSDNSYSEAIFNYNGDNGLSNLGLATRGSIKLNTGGVADRGLVIKNTGLAGFSGSVGIGTTSPVAPLHVGANVNNQSTSGPSNDPGILISRDVSDASGAGSGHGFVDMPTISRATAGIGYSSFDVRAIITGSTNYDHFVGLQDIPILDYSAVLTKLYGYYNVPTVNSGTVTNRYGNYIGNPIGAGTVTNNYGVYIENQIKGSTLDYSIYSVGGDNYLGGNLGLGTTTPGTSLAIGNTGSNTINISATATSTFGTGINLRTGCFAVNGVCISGGGGGSSGPVTTTFEFNSVEPQTDSFDFAPGGGYIQPIYGPTYTNGTSSAMIYDIVIPQNVSATPNALLIPWLTATGTPSTGIAVMDFSATTTGSGQNWYTNNFTSVHAASTTAANRFRLTTGTSLPITSTTTISLAGLNLTAGSVLKVRVVRYGADANDTVDNDVFMPKLLLQIDTN